VKRATQQELMAVDDGLIFPLKLQTPLSSLRSQGKEVTYKRSFILNSQVSWFLTVSHGIHMQGKGAS